VYEEKLDTTYEEMIKKSNGEEKEPEEFWTDLFNAVKEAYESHPSTDRRVRNTLLHFVALNCHLTGSHDSFQKQFAELTTVTPEFGTDIMRKLMASDQVYLSASGNAFTCSKCKEGAIWTLKNGREAPKFRPFCGKHPVTQKGKSIIFSHGRWMNVLPVSAKALSE
jgi:hypothetical protein